MMCKLWARKQDSVNGESGEQRKRRLLFVRKLLCLSLGMLRLAPRIMLISYDGWGFWAEGGAGAGAEMKALNKVCCWRWGDNELKMFDIKQINKQTRKSWNQGEFVSKQPPRLNKQPFPSHSPTFPRHTTHAKLSLVEGQLLQLFNFLTPFHVNHRQLNNLKHWRWFRVVDIIPSPPGNLDNFAHQIVSCQISGGQTDGTHIVRDVCRLWQLNDGDVVLVIYLVVLLGNDDDFRVDNLRWVSTVVVLAINFCFEIVLAELNDCSKNVRAVGVEINVLNAELYYNEAPSSRPCAQCAAVITNRGWISAPPHS